MEEADGLAYGLAYGLVLRDDLCDCKRFVHFVRNLQR
jgi:hypothetical protein